MLREGTRGHLPSTPTRPFNESMQACFEPTTCPAPRQFHITTVSESPAYHDKYIYETDSGAGSKATFADTSSEDGSVFTLGNGGILSSSRADGLATVTYDSAAPNDSYNTVHFSTTTDQEQTGLGCVIDDDNNSQLLCNSKWTV